MKRAGLSSILIAVTLITVVVIAEAQQPTKVHRIGYLTGVSLSAMAARTESFRQSLRELGYVDGKNIVIEWRSSEGKEDRLPSLAAELVRLKVDVIVAVGSGDIRAAKGRPPQSPLLWFRVVILLEAVSLPV